LRRFKPFLRRSDLRRERQGAWRHRSARRHDAGEWPRYCSIIMAECSQKRTMRRPVKPIGDYARGKGRHDPTRSIGLAHSHGSNEALTSETPSGASASAPLRLISPRPMLSARIMSKLLRKGHSVSSMIYFRRRLSTTYRGPNRSLQELPST
jgi:hypothetical protein